MALARQGRQACRAGEQSQSPSTFESDTPFAAYAARARGACLAGSRRHQPPDRSLLKSKPTHNRKARRTHSGETGCEEPNPRRRARGRSRQGYVEVRIEIFGPRFERGCKEATTPACFRTNGGVGDLALGSAKGDVVDSATLRKRISQDMTYKRHKVGRILWMLKPKRKGARTT
jgi:hypothetical protein